MKKLLLACLPALLLAACAGTRVSHTDIATGATRPRAIYIRPFDVSQGKFTGWHHSSGETAIRRSLAPAEFANILKEELEKIAPAMVLEEDEVPRTGWLVEGYFELIDAGNPIYRALPGNLVGAGASRIDLHVRVTDLTSRRVSVSDAKDKGLDESTTRVVANDAGQVIYEFDVRGGSKATGKFGSITAPGLGYAVPFDFRNAAERIMMTLSTDPHRYGAHFSPAIR